MPRFSKRANLLKDLEAIAKSHTIKDYLRFYLDEEDGFVSAASNSNSNTNLLPCWLSPVPLQNLASEEVAAYLTMVGGYYLVAELLPPPVDYAVTPPLSAHHVVDIPKLTECSTSL